MQAVGLLAADASRGRVAARRGRPRMKAILEPLTPRRRALRADGRRGTGYDRLAPNAGTFVTYFGGVAGQPQENAEATSTVDQALFLTNGEPIRSWLNPGPRLADSAAAPP